MCEKKKKKKKNKESNPLPLESCAKAISLCHPLSTTERCHTAMYITTANTGQYVDKGACVPPQPSLSPLPSPYFQFRQTGSKTMEIMETVMSTSSKSVEKTQTCIHAHEDQVAYLFWNSDQCGNQISEACMHKIRLFLPLLRGLNYSVLNYKNEQ